MSQSAMHGNRILAALPADELERLSAALEPFPLDFKTTLIEPNQPMTHVYFPIDGMVSIISVMADRTAVETATVGNEGMLGVPVYLGAMSMAGQAFVQVPGSALRLPAEVLRGEVSNGGVLPALLGRYTQALFTMLSQSSACNRKHSVEQRCARWLLLTHDRVSGDTFELTQLFLSQMLGIRRAGVNEVAGRLQQRGLIRYTRGRVTITDRAGLEATACECYQIVRSEFARMIENRHLPSVLDDLELSKNGKSVAGTGDEDGEEESVAGDM